MRIRILAVGRKATGWAAEAEKEYMKRLRRGVDVRLELVPHEDEHSCGGKMSAERESLKLLERFKKDEHLIACDRGGKAFTSEQFAALLRDLRDNGAKLCFVIGGSHGLSAAALARADTAVSFSPLTFPHELFRILLLEQLYRASTIMAGGKYHK